MQKDFTECSEEKFNKGGERTAWTILWREGQEFFNQNSQTTNRVVKINTSIVDTARIKDVLHALDMCYDDNNNKTLYDAIQNIYLTEFVVLLENVYRIHNTMHFDYHKERQHNRKDFIPQISVNTMYG